LLDERAELSSLLENLRIQLEKCKASALEERQKWRDERFDIGCLLAAESEKCEILEVKVRSLEQHLSVCMATCSESQQKVVVAEEELKLHRNMFSNGSTDLNHP
jgi:hypothetical protein